MNIQVLGGNGMLGQAVVRALLAHGHNAVLPTTSDLTMCAVTGNVVINCAGIVKQRHADATKLVMVNGYGPQRVADACDAIGARLIQVSTDCVFTLEGPHEEASIPSPNDTYAVSKLAGEVTRPPHLTIRTSFVGRGKRGLMADLSRDQDVVCGRYLLWSGHTVPFVADVIAQLVDIPEMSGLLHVPGEYQTRFQLASRLKDRYGLQAGIVPADDLHIDRRLVSRRWERTEIMIKSFEQQLAEME